MQRYDMDAAISIHAPVKGATSKRAAAETARQFQSTLPRRERLAKLRNPSIFSRFQSTLSRRERRKSAAVRPAESQISIHAPAKGATIEPRILTFAVRYFNPRSREGSDMYKASIMLSERHFNPRSREGSDDEHPRICKRTDDFNPRSREGSDVKIAGWKVRQDISIHAPAKGATVSALPRHAVSI